MDITSQLDDIMNNVQRIINRYNVDQNLLSGNRASIIEYKKKRRVTFLENMIAYAQRVETREKTLAYILAWLEEWNSILSDMTAMDVNEYRHWIVQMEMLPETLKAIESSVKMLSKISILLFEEKKKQRKKITSRGTLWKSWKERVTKRPAAAHALRPDQMISDEFATNTKVSEIQDMLQELIGTAMFNKMENNAIKYISTTTINLSKALSVLNDELKILNLRSASIHIDEIAESEKDVSLKIIKELSEKNEMFQQQLQDAEEKCEFLIRSKSVIEHQLYTALSALSSLKVLPKLSPQSSIPISRTGEREDSTDSILTKEFETLTDEAQRKGTKGSGVKWDPGISNAAQAEMIPDIPKEQYTSMETKQKRSSEDFTADKDDVYQKNRIDLDQSQKRKHEKESTNMHGMSGSKLSDEKGEQKVSGAKPVHHLEQQALGKKGKEIKSFPEAKLKSSTESKSHHTPSDFPFTEPKSQGGQSVTSSTGERIRKVKPEYLVDKHQISSEVKVEPTTKSKDNKSKSEMSSPAEPLGMVQLDHPSEPQKGKTKGKKHQISPGTTTSKEGKDELKEMIIFSKKGKPSPLGKPTPRITKKTSESTSALEEPNAKSEQSNLEEFHKAIMTFLHEKIDNIGKPFDKKTVVKEELLKKAEVEKLGIIKAKMEEYFQKATEVVTKTLRKYKDIKKAEQVEEKSKQPKKVVSFAQGSHFQKPSVSAKSEISTFLSHENVNPVLNNLIQMILTEIESERDAPAVSVVGKDRKEKEKQRWEEHQEMFKIPKHQLLEEKKLWKESHGISKTLEEGVASPQMEGKQRPQRQKQRQKEEEQQDQGMQKWIEKDEKRKRGEEEEEGQDQEQRQLEAWRETRRDQEGLLEMSRAQEEVSYLELKRRQEEEEEQKLRKVEDHKRQRLKIPMDRVKIKEKTAEERENLVPKTSVTLPDSIFAPTRKSLPYLGEEIHRNLKTLDTPPYGKHSIPITPPTSIQSSPLIPTESPTLSLTLEQAQALGITLTPEQVQAQGVTFTLEQAQALGLTPRLPQAQAQRVTLTPEQIEAQGITLTPEQAQAQGITFTLEQAQALGIAPTPEQVLTQRITLTRQEAQAIGITLTPEQTQAQGITLTPEQAQALGITLTPEQAQALGVTLTPKQFKALGITPIPEKSQGFGVTLIPEQVQALRSPLTLGQAPKLQIPFTSTQVQVLGPPLTLGQAQILRVPTTREQAQELKASLTSQQTQAMQIPLTTEQAQRFGVPLTQGQAEVERISLISEQEETLGITLTPEQAQAMGITLTPEQAQAQGITLTPEQVQAQGITLTPEQVQALGITLTPEQAQALGITLTPEQAQALGITLTPEQAQAQGITLTPEQVQALGITLTPEQAQAQGITLTPEQAQALGITLTPEQVQALGITLTPEQAQALGITLTPEQAQAQGITLTPEQAQALGITLTPEQAQALGITLTPEQVQALGITLTPEQAQALGITLTPEQAQAQGITLTPEQVQALGITLTPEQAQALGITLTPEQVQAQGITLTPEQAQALGITLTPEQAQALGITLTLEQAQALGITLTPEQAQALGITLTPEQAQAQGITLTPEQVQALGITLTPEQAQAMGITLTPEQAQAMGITLTPEQAQAQGITLTPEQAQAQGITLTPEQIQALGPPLNLKQAQSLWVPLTPEQAAALKAPPTEQTWKLGVPISLEKAQEALEVTCFPEQAQALGTPLTVEQAQALGVPFGPENAWVSTITRNLEQAQAFGSPLTLEQAQALGVPLTPEHIWELKVPLTSDKDIALGPPPIPEKVQPLGVPFTPGQDQLVDITVMPKQDAKSKSLTAHQLSQLQAGSFSRHSLEVGTFPITAKPILPSDPHIPKQSLISVPSTLGPFQELKAPLPSGKSFTSRSSPRSSQFLASSHIVAKPPILGVSSPLQISKSPLTQARKSLEMKISSDSGKFLAPLTFPSSRQTLVSSPMGFLAPKVPPNSGQLPMFGRPQIPGQHFALGGLLRNRQVFTSRGFPTPQPPLTLVVPLASKPRVPPSSGQIPSLQAPLSPGEVLEYGPLTLPEQPQAFQSPSSPKQSLHPWAPSTLGQHLAPWIPSIPGQPSPLWNPPSPGKPQKGLTSSFSEKSKKELAIISSLKSKSAFVHPSTPKFKAPQAPFMAKKLQMPEISDISEETQMLPDPFAMEQFRTFQSYLSSYRTPLSQTPHVDEGDIPTFLRPVTSLPSLTTQLPRSSQLPLSEGDQTPRFPPIDKSWILTSVPVPKKPRVMVSLSSPQELEEEERYIIDVEAQRKNLVLLNQAIKTSGLPSSLHKTARNLVIETLHMDRVRLGYIFHKYIAYRLIQRARNNIIRQLQTIHNTGKGNEARNLYKMLSRIDDYQKKVMQVWTEKQKSLEQQRNHCLKKMVYLFSQLQKRYELNLSQPIIITDKKQIPTSTEFVHRPFLELLIEEDRKSDTVKKFRKQEDQMEAIWNADLSTSSYPITEKTSLKSLWAKLGGYPDIPRLLQLDVQSTLRKSLASIQSQFKKIPR
ncbi:protein FAM186A isoform X2 [Dasypus novemcinctus]|uniref:protein FAM186A isoform X2 n=1 Tax=Dasypus novemcinctus TaxID=9361 RepID=UPI00265DF17D|nr:protein FAM186A isoform X2 [Dasypus novemcinctus]